MKENATRPTENRRKRPLTLLIVLAAVAVFCIAALALAEPIGRALASLNDAETESPENHPVYGFFDGHYADWELEEWAELKRYIAYSVGGETIELNEDTLHYFGPEAAVFTAFFEAITNGDAATYASLFTEHYYETNERLNAFDRQLAYDIEVTMLSDTTDNGVRTFRYEVGYKLYHNNGTLRRDVGSGKSRPQIFTVVETADGYRIDAIAAVRSK